jgi:hypothetical protein
VTSALGIVIAAEDESDARRIKSLVDRLLAAEIDWVRDQPELQRALLLAALREWWGHDETSSYLDIHKVHELADRRRAARAAVPQRECAEEREVGLQDARG